MSPWFAILGLTYLFSRGSDSYCVYIQASLTVLLYVRTQQTDLLSNTLSTNTAVAQGLNNKLNIYQQKYIKICEAGATLVLFNVQSHPDILYGNRCLDTCKFYEAYFVSNKYFIFTLITKRFWLQNIKDIILCSYQANWLNNVYCCTNICTNK